MILTEQIEIKKTDNLTSGYIESELAKLKILPLRWAIVSMNEHAYLLDVSYEINKS